MARKKKEETSNNIAAYRMEFWYRIAMILLALVVMISVGLAWFANNREVNATQMSVRTSPGPFELAAEGSSGSYDTYTENGETKNRLSDGFYVPTETVEFTAYDNNTPHTGYKTSGSATSISWAVSSYSNLNNNTQSGVDPGASGSITFYIIPSEDGDLTVTLNLSLIGLVEQKEADGTITYQDAKSKNPDAQTLLEHHLLLFAGFDKTNNSYNHWISPDAGKWSGLTLPYSDSDSTSETTPSATLSYDAGNNTLTWNGTNLKGGKAYPVTIYWIWPDLLGQYIFSGKNEAIGSRPVLFPGELPNKLFDNMSTAYEGTNANAYLMWQESESDQTSVNDFTADVTSDALNKLRGNNGNMAQYNKICTYYNKADQYIGENIRYVRLRLDAQ